MHSRERRGDHPQLRWRRQRGWGAAILVAGLVLFVWPFVRTPPLSIGLSYAHLLASWLLVVAGLLAMARALAPGRGGRGGEDG